MNVGALFDLDAATLVRGIGIALGVSLLVAVLQASLVQLIWSVWNLVVICFAVLSRIVLTFVSFLGRLIDEGIDGLAAEGDAASSGSIRRPRPRVGWLIIGPLVYCALMLVFMASDLTVAILIFEAMGLTLGAAVRSSLPIPLDAAMGVVFVALAVFWGIVLFDVLGLTPFEHTWRRLTDVQRRRLARLVLGCLGLTLLAGTAMGLWSQAQLSGGLPAPYQTLLPWAIRASLVALLLCATALSGKPFGSAVTAAFVLGLLLVRAVGWVVLVVLRLVLALLRASIWVPLALVGLVASVAHSLWNWLAGGAAAQRLRIGRLVVPTLGPPGGDDGSPELFGPAGPPRPVSQAELERNKTAVRRLYEELLLEPAARLEEVVALDVVHHDPRAGRVVGIGYLERLAAELRASYTAARIRVDEQVGEGERIVSRFVLSGRLAGQPVVVAGVDLATLRHGKIVERSGVLGTPQAASAADAEAPERAWVGGAYPGARAAEG